MGSNSFNRDSQLPCKYKTGQAKHFHINGNNQTNTGKKTRLAEAALQQTCDANALQKLCPERKTIYCFILCFNLVMILHSLSYVSAYC